MTLKYRATANGKSGSDLLPEGEYDAILVKVQEAQNSDGSYLKWSYEVSRHGEGHVVTGVTPAHLEPGSKARFWSEALLGRALKDDEELDLEKLYGRVAHLTLTVIEREGRQFNRIGRVEKRGGVTMTARKASAAPPGDEGKLDDGEGAF